jgi:hypothetical protein
MTKRIVGFISALALTGGVVVSSQADETRTLPVPLQAQKDENWCWAAATQMMINFAEPGNFQPQCGVVEKLGKDEQGNKLTGKCCGHSSVPAVCSVGGILRDGDFAKFGLRARSTSAYTWLAWRDITDEIDAGFPLLDWAGGHMRVISGYRVSSAGVKRLWIQDPWPPEDESGTGGHGAYIQYKTYTNECYRTFYHVQKGPQP